MLGAGGALAWAFSYFQHQTSDIAAEEARFVTTEWHLLRELHEQTQEQLLAKEQEIAELRLRYLQLTEDDSTAHEREEIETQLRRAEEERDALIARRLQAATEAVQPTETEEPELIPDVETDPDPDHPSVAEVEPESLHELGPRLELDLEREESPREPTLRSLLQSERPSSTISRAVTESLREQVSALEEQLTEREAAAATLREEIELLEDRLERMEAEYQRALEDQREPIEALRQEAADARRSARSALTALKELELARLTSAAPVDPPPPDYADDIDVLGTRPLLRAIVTSPEIRAEYPDLRERMDAYFALLEHEKITQGRAEAYRVASEAVEETARKLDIDLEAENKRDTASGYVERLVALVEHALEHGAPEP